MKEVKIIKENLEEAGMPLYIQYEGQCNPQPANITIDPRDGEKIIVSADYDSNIGTGCSFDEFHGLVKSFSCHPAVLGCALIAYLESDAFQELIKELCEGFKLEWDGSNHIGIWPVDDSPTGSQIAWAIEGDLRGLEVGEVYTGRDWIEDGLAFYDEDGKSCDYAYEAMSALYGKIPVTEENFHKLVQEAEEYISSNQLVIGLEKAFEEIINEIELNQ